MEANSGRDAVGGAEAGRDQSNRANRQKLPDELSGSPGMAGISRRGPRGALARAEDLDELERAPAAAALENRGGASLVLVCGRRADAFHAGATGPQGDCGVLRQRFREGNLE